MPDIPDAAVRAAADVRALQWDRKFGHIAGSRERFEAEAREILEAAAPILAEHVAQAIIAHADRQFPKNDPAKRPGQPDVWRTWHRHFGIAARVAAGAFFTREDKLRMAAEALNRGDYTACPALEGEDDHR